MKYNISQYDSYEFLSQDTVVTNSYKSNVQIRNMKVGTFYFRTTRVHGMVNTHWTHTFYTPRKVQPDRTKIVVNVCEFVFFDLESSVSFMEMFYKGITINDLIAFNKL